MATTPSLAVGQRVVVAQRAGTIKFVGETKFSAGTWVGVALDEKVGKNNGKVQNVQYFECEDNHGIFVKPDHVQVLDGDLPQAKRASARKNSATPAKSLAVPAAEKSEVGMDKTSSVKSESGEEAKSKAMQTLELLRKNVPELRKRIAQQNQLIEKEKQPHSEPDAAQLESELNEYKAANDKIQRQIHTGEAQVTQLEQEIETLKDQKNSAKANSNASEDLSKLRRELHKAELEIELEEQRYQELQLDLEEFELSQEEEKALFSRNQTKNDSKFAASSKMVSEYEVALQLLKETSEKDLGNLRERVEWFEQESNKVVGLKTSHQELSQKKQDLQDSIISMESEYSEQRTLGQTSDQLQDVHGNLTTEYKKQLDLLDKRVEKYEVLVERMHKEQLEVEAAVTADENRAKELADQIQQLTEEERSTETPADATSTSVNMDKNGPLERHSRVVSAAVRQQLASLAASSAVCRAEAFASCIPEAWKPGSENTGTVDREALGKVAESASVISLVESCLCRAEALTGHLCTSCLASLPPGSEQKAKWLCALCLICGSSAAAAATALCKLRALPPDSEQTRKNGPVEVIITEKEGNLGLIVKGVPPAKMLPVEKVAEGSLAEKHEIKPKSTLIAVQGKTTEKMNLDTFKKVMKERPLHLLLRPPQQLDGKNSTFNLNLDMETCTKAQECLDKLLKSSRGGIPDPDPEILQTVGTLESQFQALQLCAPADLEEQPVSRCVIALVLRRIEAVYRFGVNVAPREPAEEPRPRPREELVRKLDEIAGRLHIADATKELNASSGHAQNSDDKPLPAETLEELLAKLATLEGALRKSTSNEDILTVLDGSAPELLHSLDVVNKTWPAHRSKYSRGGFGSSYAPGWTGCASCVQHEVDQVFEMQHQVKDERASLVELNLAEQAAQKRLEEATKKYEDLQKEVDALKERCDECSALDAEAEMLQTKAKQDTIAQADLSQALEDARAAREEQERASRDSAAKLAVLERDLEERRNRPQQELEGRATPQELAILRQKSVKGARDLYAMQVESSLGLEPLPMLSSEPSPDAKKVESCASGYVGLRRSLILEWAGTRLSKLAPAKDKPSTDLVAVKIGRIQQLQMQLNQLRKTIELVVETVEAPPSFEKPEATGKEPVRIKLDLQCPRWAAMPPKTALSMAVTFEELRKLHDVIV